MDFTQEQLFGAAMKLLNSPAEKIIFAYVGALQMETTVGVLSTVKTYHGHLDFIWRPSKDLRSRIYLSEEIEPMSQTIFNLLRKEEAEFNSFLERYMLPTKNNFIKLRFQPKTDMS